MVHETPAWRYQTQHSVTLGYGHVHLLPHHVLGQWFCVDRERGRVLWDRKVTAADCVIGVSEGVIIASKLRMSGPGTYTYGVFAISLSTGELLWTSHKAKGVTSGFGSALMKGLGVRTADHATCVRGAECFTAVGRVLDIHTGKELRRVSPPKDWAEFLKATSPAQMLYERRPVDCGSGRILRHGLPGAPKKDGGFPDGTFNLFLTDKGGRVLWSFDISDSGHHIRGNYFSYRYSNNYVYMMVSDRPQTVPIDPSKPLIVKDNPAHYFLWVLDVGTGQIGQKLRITEAETANCRIEDVDARAAVVSCDRSVLLFTRQENGRVLGALDSVYKGV